MIKIPTNIKAFYRNTTVNDLVKARLYRDVIKDMPTSKAEKKKLTLEMEAYIKLLEGKL